jgi:hypothetical protein
MFTAFLITLIGMKSDAQGGYHVSYRLDGPEENSRCVSESMVITKIPKLSEIK